jgi:hypothetical protein
MHNGMPPAENAWQRVRQTYHFKIPNNYRKTKDAIFQGG